MNRGLLTDLETQGFCFIENLEPEQSTFAVAHAVGDVLVPWQDGAVQTLVPRPISTPNTYSGIFGVGDFPFHTDLAHWDIPPRYLLLRCLKGYPEITTNLIDGWEMIPEITLNDLTRAIVRPRRPIEGKIKLLRLADETGHTSRLRWDEVFLVPSSRVGKLTFSRVHEWLQSAGQTKLCLMNPGDTLVIDNWRMLHARSHIPEKCKDRMVERVYLKALK